MGKDEGESCYPCACAVSIRRGVAGAVDACLAGKLRPLEACTFSLFLVLKCAGAEPSPVSLQADTFLLEQPLPVQDSDH